MGKKRQVRSVTSISVPPDLKRRMDKVKEPVNWSAVACQAFEQKLAEISAMTCQFVINEVEARALDALAGYGDNAFIEAFYEKLGKAYMRNHEDGLRSFLTTIRDVVTPAIGMVDDARKQIGQG
ncbi:MAG: hypothetical protein ACYSWU_17370 [Planctomycetota bacterium]|jgi:hypothetical protein